MPNLQARYSGAEDESVQVCRAPFHRAVGRETLLCAHVRQGLLVTPAGVWRRHLPDGTARVGGSFRMWRRTLVRSARPAAAARARRGGVDGTLDVRAAPSGGARPLPCDPRRREAPCGGQRRWHGAPRPAERARVPLVAGNAQVSPSRWTTRVSRVGSQQRPWCKRPRGPGEGSATGHPCLADRLP